MEQVELAVQPRELLGKKVRFLRRTGYTPANIYGKGRASTAVQVETKTLLQALRKTGRTGFLSLLLDGTSQPALARGVQLDPRTNGVIHVDFYAISLTEKLVTEVPLELSGERADLRVVKGQLIQYLSRLQIRALPTDIPRTIQVDISGLKEIDQAILVKDIHVPEALEVLSNPDETVAKVEMIREEKAPEAAELPAEVEVVGKGGKEEAAEEGAAAPAAKEAAPQPRGAAAKEAPAPKGKE
ncbi:MAG: 50S ribosomal protein L25 [Chloroflexi bacterium]|nr:50S ribosomal protein L25 [Chloroflexota bacterium]